MCISHISNCLIMFAFIVHLDFKCIIIIIIFII